VLLASARKPCINSQLNAGHWKTRAVYLGLAKDLERHMNKSREKPQIIDTIPQRFIHFSTKMYIMFVRHDLKHVLIVQYLSNGQINKDDQVFKD